MELNLKDKVALVTGGSRGLGRTICTSLAAEGVHVAVNCTSSRELAEQVAGEIRDNYNVKAAVVVADVSAEEQVEDMFTQVDEAFGRCDILVNNAATCPTSPVVDMTAEQWRHTIDVNLNGTFFCSRAFVRRLLAAGRPGRIVNIVSQAAFRGSTTGHSPYDASKGGIVSFTVALAREVADKGIAVNAVAPGMIRTEMVERVLTNNLEKYLDRIPLRRIAGPEEIADVVAFLASERASYMTGATVDVSGGMLMR
ncbi:MAG: 3-oxoacyl-ACP reductase FabG [Phycisphaerae bacterium]|nr:3-oxoacyl-ACP reductase FabG [Phycisphaerae bacterium]